MQTEVENQTTTFEDDTSQLEMLIYKAGFRIEKKPKGKLNVEQKIQYRYSLLAAYYGDAAHYATIDLPLSHDYRQAVEASMVVGGSYQLPQFDPIEDRGLDNMLGDLAILKRDMAFVPKHLQEEGKRAINTLEFYLPSNQKRKLA